VVGKHIGIQVLCHRLARSGTSQVEEFEGRNQVLRRRVRRWERAYRRQFHLVLKWSCPGIGVDENITAGSAVKGSPTTAPVSVAADFNAA
jgi:hypothetical protein